MTQAENVKRFKWVQAEAKKLKAKNKKLSHIEAVKQAWAILAKKHPSAKATGKKIGAVKKKAAKKAAPKKKAAKKAAPKKTATKKAATKKACYHKDTNSHNVRVSVMSGISINKEKILKRLNELNGELFYSLDALAAQVHSKNKIEAAKTRKHIAWLKKTKAHYEKAIK